MGTRRKRPGARWRRGGGGSRHWLSIGLNWNQLLWQALASPHRLPSPGIHKVDLTNSGEFITPLASKVLCSIPFCSKLACLLTYSLLPHLVPGLLSEPENRISHYFNFYHLQMSWRELSVNYLLTYITGTLSVTQDSGGCGGVSREKWLLH